MEALAPFRRPSRVPAGDPQPLPYLDSTDNRAHGAVDVTLEVWLQTAAMRDKACRPSACRKQFADAAYWTVAQLVAHHTSNGCNAADRRPAGLGHAVGAAAGAGRLAAGTVRAASSRSRCPTASSAPSSADGDRITLRGHCARDGFRRIGFGDCRTAD
jgi:fumarylacetoacetase